MERKSAEKLQQQRDEVYQDRWDRLRRNPDYIRDYRKYKKLYGQQKKIKGLRTATRAGTKVFNIEAKWGISYPADPKSAIFPSSSSFEFVSFLPVLSCNNGSLRYPISERVFEVVDEFHKGRGPRPRRKAQAHEVLEDGRLLHLVIDLNGTVEVLHSQIKKAIRLTKEHYGHLLPSLSELRKRIKENQEAYQVWDLVHEGKPFTEIALIVYKKVPQAKGADRARKAYRKAYRLIRGVVLDSKSSQEISCDEATIHCPTCRGDPCIKLAKGEKCDCLELFINQDSVLNSRETPQGTKVETYAVGESFNDSEENSKN